MLVEERSVGSGGGGGEEEEVDDDGGANPRNDTGTAPAAEPEEQDRSTSLGAPLEISHSEASPPAAHQTRGPEGGDRDDDEEDASSAAAEDPRPAPPPAPPPSLSHGAAATVSASTFGAPGSLHADTRISSLASHRDRTPREEPVRIQEEPTGSATTARMEPSQAGGVRTQASWEEGGGEVLLLLAQPPPLLLPLPPPLRRCRRSQPCTPPRAVE